ncbi:MAG TPA: PQQ-dependent sugar dehydrogenase, partial [Candidatus Caenarcaniphilales bacterium]|nr:PQQ-dependent sugar dehydrogenase [Candidatus Caenarcaniphilales bacterium]
GSLLGKLLRIDVDAAEPYAIPADNPFTDQPPARPEIWAWGLRNPWRFSFDAETGDLFIGDVGQGKWEEIDAERGGSGGRNYGWNVMEGPDCFRQPGCDTNELTPPVAWYPRAGDNCAVTGGYVYRGQEFPALTGAYLFADYCSGTVWGLDATAAIRHGSAQAAELGASQINPAAFGEDQAGELFLVGQGGEILRLVASER